MRVAITGGTGMIGAALAEALRSRGDEVWVFTRSQPRSSHDIQWNPSRPISGVRHLEGLDAVVNLCGAPLATRPWTRTRRHVLVASRVDATHQLIQSLASLSHPPRALIGAGLLGRFGDRGEAWIDDDDPVSTGFLAELASSWEDANLGAGKAWGARVAVLRMALVLGGAGAFPLMVLPFRHGFGGWLGDGRQYTAWLSLDDAVGAFLHLIDHPDAEGGFNGSVPDPVPNRAWCEALGRALGKPVKTHAPKWALRGALGELANGVFLASCRARPRKLIEAGFRFRDPEVEPVFRRLAAGLDQSDG